MTPHRRDAVLASLRAGNWIYMRWSGSERNGRLRYSLFGVDRLLESEIFELRNEGLLAVMRSNELADETPYRRFQWKPYRLKECRVREACV